MKKGLALILTVALLLTGCGGASAQANTQEKADAAQKEAVVTEEASADEAEKTEAQEPAAAAETTDTTAEEAPQETATAASDTLILYFSRTGEQYVVGVIDKGNTAIVAEMIAEQTGADLFEVLPADDHYPMTYDALTDVAKQEQNEKARPEYSGTLPDLSKYSTIFIGSPVGLSGFDKKLASACPDSTIGKGLAIEGNDAQNNQDKTRESVSGWLTELGF